ncbi:hypothetical protein RJ639_030575 [Escallonia herrerae]|uniref:Uncharacterized protein n=1 Tax=Escallonia herrerae TaxID=1293975 RepID=A0AA88X375_9ASTE|nr:hypothetical protein RJ639_030575 [Escallonia herrerae]
MWQALLAAAAVAGSGFLATQLLNNNGYKPITISNKTNQECDQLEDPQEVSSQFQGLSPLCGEYNCNIGTERSTFGDESIFRFSSASGFQEGGGSRSGLKGLRKKSSSGAKGKAEKKSGLKGKDCGEDLVVDQRKSGKAMSSSCLNCVVYFREPIIWFGTWCRANVHGVTWESESSRLNTTMDETAKVVQDLKAEIAKRKKSCNLHASSSKSEGSANPKRIRGKHAQQVHAISRTLNVDNTGASGLLVTDEGECGSSVLTEELQPETMDMDQLKAELESELQKLPQCTTEASGPEDGILDTFSNGILAEEYREPNGHNSESYRYNGVLPSELDKKLCHLLIEQQESQIVELESDLQQAHSKLHDKEAELQAPKECVRRLTEFSLANASDEETEAQLEEKKESDEAQDKMGLESRKSVAGTKRGMDFKSYGTDLDVDQLIEHNVLNFDMALRIYGENEKRF